MGGKVDSRGRCSQNQMVAPHCLQETSASKLMMTQYMSSSKIVAQLVPSDGSPIKTQVTSRDVDFSNFKIQTQPLILPQKRTGSRYSVAQSVWTLQHPVPQDELK